MASNKTCIRCKETKPLNEFYRDCTQKYGRSRYCAECSRFIDKRVIVRKDSIHAIRAERNSNFGRYRIRKLTDFLISELDSYTVEEQLQLIEGISYNVKKHILSKLN